MGILEIAARHRRDTVTGEPFYFIHKALLTTPGHYWRMLWSILHVRPLRGTIMSFTDACWHDGIFFSSSLFVSSLLHLTLLLITLVLFCFILSWIQRRKHSFSAIYTRQSIWNAGVTGSFMLLGEDRISGVNRIVYYIIYIYNLYIPV